MKYIINKLKKIFKHEEKILLGRWRISYCSKKIGDRVDLANEDHCGTCGEYILDKASKQIIDTDKNKL